VKWIGQKAAFSVDNQADALLLDRSLIWYRQRDERRPYPYYVVGKGMVGKQVSLLLHPAYSQNEIPPRILSSEPGHSAIIERAPLVAVPTKIQDYRLWQDYLGRHNGVVYRPEESKGGFYNPITRQFAMSERAPRAYELAAPENEYVPRGLKARAANRLQKLFEGNRPQEGHITAGPQSYFRDSLPTEQYLAYGVIDHLVGAACSYGLEKQLDSMLAIKQAQAVSEDTFLDS
jgi:hypothetical protein